MFLWDQKRHEELTQMAAREGWHLELACEFRKSTGDKGKTKPQLANEHQAVLNEIAGIVSLDGGEIFTSGSADFKVTASVDAYRKILKVFDLNRVEAVSCIGKIDAKNQRALAL